MKTRMKQMTALLNVLFLLAPAAHATTYYVATNGNDSAAGTNWLTARQTIQAAIDLTVSNDTVRVSNGVYNTGGYLYGGITNRLVVTNAISITSVNGPDSTTIAGQGPIGPSAIRCAYLGSCSFLSGFSLSNGATKETSDDSGSGGGAYCVDDSCIISNCIISGNSAYNYAGGAYRGTYRNSTLSNNVSTYGYVGGTYGSVMHNCRLIRNTGYTVGGAYFCTLSNCEVTGNAAILSGGGVGGSTLFNCTLTSNMIVGNGNGGGASGSTLYNCRLVGNSAFPDQWGNGGGASGCTLFECTLSNNSASVGGAAASCTLYNSIIQGNTATHNGGGGHMCSYYNCIISANSVSNGVGGGVDNEGYSYELVNCTIMNNTALEGGGVYRANAINCIIRNNTATNAANYDGSSAISFSCTFPIPTNGAANVTNSPLFDATNNFHLVAGSPGIDSGTNQSWMVGTLDLGASPRIRNGTVDVGAYEYLGTSTWYVVTNGNDTAAGTNWVTAKATIQAAIDAAYSNDTVIVSNGVYATGGRVVFGAMTNRIAITNAITVRSLNGPSNTVIAGAADPVSTNGNASVRCAYVGTNAHLSGFTLTNGHTRAYPGNFEEYCGGGVYCEYSVIVSNCLISGNSAGLQGGGVLGHCWSGREVLLINCTLSGNSAGFGGGVFDSSGSGYTILKNCTLSDNNAASQGGGTWSCNLYNCLLRGNSSYYTGGSYRGAVINCTVVGNSATYDGGTTQCTLRNSIVCYNNGTYFKDDESSSMVNSCVPTAPSGFGNITNAPLFVSMSDFHLATNSPCIDRGNNANAQGTTDLDGNLRVLFGVVDMGAYEAQFPIGYWAWAASITNGLTNLNQSAIGDGHANLLKYAAGSCPTNSDNLAAMSGTQTTNGFFALNFNRNTNANDITLIAEGNYDLTNSAAWNGIATNIAGSWGGAANVTETGTGTPVAVSIQDPAPTATNRFLRLRVTRP